MLNGIVDRATRPLAGLLQADHMKRLGIANTMRVASSLNGLREREQVAHRRALYRTEFPALLRDNGEATTTIEMGDGWALDTSRSLPHLQRLLDESAEIIEQRAGVRRRKPGAYRSFFQDIREPGDLERYPSILDFALSSDVLKIVSDYLRCVPAFFDHLPGGIRFAESSIEYDDRPDVMKDSQLFHIDYFSKPCVYMIVLLKDVTEVNGPFCFVPASRSREAASRLNYWGRGRPYRLSDEEVYTAITKEDVIPLAYPKGTVLFLDPSACLHFGSRRSVEPRYQLMYAYGTTCRTDFNAYLTKAHAYPARAGDSRLARMVLSPAER
jgi:hypothetical protein